MTPTEVHQLLEKCKAATAENRSSLRNRSDEYLLASAPSNIQTLAQNYLEALEVLKQLLIASEKHSELTNTIWPSMDDQMKSAETFLKKVGIDASEGKGRE